MFRTMRWFGPDDPVTLSSIRQAGAQGIVTSLHHIPVGEVWPVEEIQKRQQLLATHHLPWTVVESLPVHEAIKKAEGSAETLINNYIQSLYNLASCGIRIVTYNFMPVLDWVRTDHENRNDDGTSTLSFEKRALTFFDREILSRSQADADYSPEEIRAANDFGRNLTTAGRRKLINYILLGLPGSSENFDLEILETGIAGYAGITRERLQHNLVRFLKAVIPAAEEAGILLALHPDDPPFSVLGLPRGVCNGDDLGRIFDEVPSQNNGLCFCTGSLGAHPGNDLMNILRRFSDRIHFLHLRNVVKSNAYDFRESPHLQGDVPMEDIVAKVLEIMRTKGSSIPMRPDHGFLFETDRRTGSYPGYSFTGRMKALAELYGLETGLIKYLNN